MAITVVQSVIFSVGSAANATAAVTSTGSGNLLVCAFRTGAAPGGATVNVGTNNLVFASYDTAVFVQCFYLNNCASGQTQVSINYNPNSNTTTAVLYEVSGFHSATHYTESGLASGVQSGGSATCPAIVANFQPGFMSAMDVSVGAISACTGAFTFNGVDTNGNGWASLGFTTTGTKTPIFTDNGATFHGYTVAFRERADQMMTLGMG